MKFIALFLTLLFVSACSHHHKVYNKKGIAQVMPTKGSKVEGIVHFEKLDKHKMQVKAVIRGLKPKGKYGFHIHEFGNCTSEDGKSAGGHFNPRGKKHGSESSKERHMGDLGNLEANENGIAFYDTTFEHMSLSHPGYGIAGRGLIVHAQADDLHSQPTGNAGARQACGVIGIDKE